MGKEYETYSKEKHLCAAKDWPTSFKPDEIKESWILHCVISLGLGEENKPEILQEKDSKNFKTVGSLMKNLQSHKDKILRLVFATKEAAMAGSGETTMVPTPYKCVLKSYTSEMQPQLWDLPGCGTRN